MIKQLIIVISLLAFSFNGMAQSNNPMGSALNFTKTMKLPTRKEVGKKEVTGKYIFTVDIDGTLTNIRVKDSMGYGLDDQVVKKLSEAKNWKVAEIDGIKTAVSYTLPLRVALPKK